MMLGALRGDRDHVLRRAVGLFVLVAAIQTIFGDSAIALRLGTAAVVVFPEGSRGVRRVALGNEERLPDKFKASK